MDLVFFHRKHVYISATFLRLDENSLLFLVLEINCNYKKRMISDNWLFLVAEECN